MGVTFINPFLSAAAPPAFNDPSDLFGSGEKGGWWDGSDLTTLWTDNHSTNVASASDPVYYWDDKSGNGNHFLQATGTAQPAYQTSGIVFDGSSDVINIPGPVGLATTQLSAFIVFKVNSWSSGRSLLSVSPNSSTNEFDGVNRACLFRIATDNAAIYAVRNSGDVGSMALSPDGSGATTIALAESVFDGTYHTMTLQGTSSATSSSTGSFASDYVRSCDWIAYGGGTFASATIAELVLIDRVLTGTELTALRSYLDTKWTLGL